jgi:hypothetical protein
MVEGDYVVFFDEDGIDEGRITFRNGQFIEVEKENGETTYVYPLDVQAVSE